MVGDTGSIGGITSGCGKIPEHTGRRCQALRTKTFILMSNFASRGLCLYDLAKQVCCTALFYYKTSRLSSGVHFDFP